MGTRTESGHHSGGDVSLGFVLIQVPLARLTYRGKPRAIRKQTPPTTSTDLASPVGPASRSLPVKDEAAEIEALCMSHRTRTPVAIALGNDWSEAPFRVPRRFIVLGWFWVADAWVSGMPPVLSLLTDRSILSPCHLPPSQAALSQLPPQRQQMSKRYAGSSASNGVDHKPLPGGNLRPNQTASSFHLMRTPSRRDGPLPDRQSPRHGLYDRQSTRRVHRCL